MGGTYLPLSLQGPPDSHCPSTNLPLEGPCDLVIIAPRFYLSFSTLAIHAFIQQVFVKYLLHAGCIDFNSLPSYFTPCFHFHDCSFQARGSESAFTSSAHRAFLCFGNERATVTGCPTLRSAPKDRAAATFPFFPSHHGCACASVSSPSPLPCYLSSYSAWPSGLMPVAI